MNDDRKKSIYNSMTEHLKSVGWEPGKDQHEIVMGELPSLWNKLIKEGLVNDAIRAGFSFKQFAKVARTMLHLKTFNFEVRLS